MFTLMFLSPARGRLGEGESTKKGLAGNSVYL